MTTTFIPLTKEQVRAKINFIKTYKKAKNPADGSLVDANANVTDKNSSTLNAELHKPENVQISRQLICDELETLYGKEIADEYISQLESHLIYCHDESSSVAIPYCMAVSLHPYVYNGLKGLGGDSIAPKHLDSFCGGFVNVILALAGQVAGAVATGEFLVYFDYFARKDFGDDYLYSPSIKFIKDRFEQIIYLENQPAVARNSQSVFWNVSCFDKYYLESQFKSMTYPDGTKVNFDSIMRLQKYFLKWINKERERALLTFPVITVSMLLNPETKTPMDIDFKCFIAEEMSKGNKFFIYESESVDSLSSCCRLRNEINEGNTFTHTLGNLGVMTGSIRVITINMNRFIQVCYMEHKEENGLMDHIKAELKKEIQLLHKFHHAHRNVLKDMFSDGMFPAYSAGYIDLNKQYSTIGINGMVEAAEYLEIEPRPCNEYFEFIRNLLQVIFLTNKEGKKEYGFRFNTEFVPAENLGVKNAMWDKKDGLFVPRPVYNSYFYAVEDDSLNIIDKFILQGKQTTEWLDGGSALHLNLLDHPTFEQAMSLLDIAGKIGCPFWCINVLSTCCNDCEYIHNRFVSACPQCGSQNIDYATRIIGYLKRITSFSSERQSEAIRRHYHLLGL